MLKFGLLVFLFGVGLIAVSFVEPARVTTFFIDWLGEGGGTWPIIVSGIGCIFAGTPLAIYFVTPEDYWKENR